MFSKFIAVAKMVRSSSFVILLQDIRILVTNELSAIANSGTAKFLFLRFLYKGFLCLEL